MNKKYLFLLLVFSGYVNAQNPINVIITDSCSPVAGIYYFNGIVNTKNDYTRTATLNGLTAVVHVGFDGVRWVLYQGSLSSAGFFNLTVPVGVLPPLTGWQLNPPNGCISGTMVISNNLAVESFSKVRFSIYPNPASNFLKITDNVENDIFNYQIIDLNGRIISIGSASEIIDISDLQTGIYILKSEQDTIRFVKI